MKHIFETYLEEWAKKENVAHFDYEDGAIFPCKSGRFSSLEEVAVHMEFSQIEEEAENDRIQTDEYYRSEQYKIDKAMGEI